jgi:hypothetical protein
MTSTVATGQLGNWATGQLGGEFGTNSNGRRDT